MAITIQKLADTPGKSVFLFINDTAAVESNVVKVDASTLDLANTAPRLALSSVDYSVEGGSVTLLWHATANVEAISLSGNGNMIFGQHPIKNEAGAGVSGDVLISTKNFGASNGSNYSIVASFSKVSGWTSSAGSDSLG